MKKYFKLLPAMIFAAAILVSFNPPKHNIIGRWIDYAKDGSIGDYINFKEDGGYEVVLPNKQVVDAGIYKLVHSTFSIKNAKAICGKDYWGVYKVTFHGEDSISFAVIRDSCAMRKGQIVGGLKREKTE